MQRFRPRAIVIIPVIVGVLLLAAVAALARPQTSSDITAGLITAAGGENAGAVTRALNTGADAGFQRVTEPKPLQFPTDHGPHPQYQTEWWYWTGNLQAADGRLFGYQLTFFRRGLVADPVPRDSRWGASDVYFAHFAVTDVAGKQFYPSSKAARGADIGLAGAAADPFRVFVQDWSASGTIETAHLRAQSAIVAIDLSTSALKPIVLQGDRGYSPKAEGEGYATYYYSLPRLETTGTITINGEHIAVSGLSWLDREWGTNPLSPDQTGWDWFGLHLDDGRDVMIGHVRRTDGSADVLGAVIDDQATSPTYEIEGVQLSVEDTWTSPTTGIAYPARWRLRLPEADLDVTIAALIPNQELNVGLLYWEGAVQVSGSATGMGYMELTGYQP